MKTRGETQYIKMPFFAVRLYDNMTSIKGINKSFEEIAGLIGSIMKQGNLLDIGTGPGRLLSEISKQVPQVKLFGLDISNSMINLAKQNLENIPNVDLRIGNINRTDFKDSFFDCVVSTGSFYNWDTPVQGLNEIYRILKPGKTAFIFDTYKDFDKKLLNEKLKENLQGYNLFRKTASKYFLRKQLRMTYSINDYDKILIQTNFKNSFKVQPQVLGNLPVHVRLELTKI
jgi:ubiquinone/menaquinone biosynthesis C-methylase UbiE